MTSSSDKTCCWVSILCILKEWSAYTFTCWGSKNQETLTQHHIPVDPNYLKHCYETFLTFFYLGSKVSMHNMTLWGRGNPHTMHRLECSSVSLPVKTNVLDITLLNLYNTIPTHIKKWHNMKNVQKFLAHLQWHLIVRLYTVQKWNQWRKVNQFSSSSWSYTIAHFSIPLRYCRDSPFGTVYCGGPPIITWHTYNLTNAGNMPATQNFQLTAETSNICLMIHPST
jgi:hypothetical protein